MRLFPDRMANTVRSFPAFSLVELLAVIAIMSILLLVGAGVMSPNESRRTSMARDMVNAHLEQARSHAISTGLPTAVVFAPSDPNLGRNSGRILGVVEISGADKNTKLLSRWTELPRGQIFMPQALASLTRPTILDNEARLLVSYRGEQSQAVELTMPYVLFGSEGSVLHPVGEKITIAVGAGIALNSGALQLTGANRGKETAMVIQVSPLSGKARTLNPYQN